MDLKQGHGLDQQVVTRAQQIHIEQKVISDETVHPFIVGDGISRSKLNDNLFVGILLDWALYLIKSKDVARVDKKLKLRIKVWVIVNC